MSEQQEPEIFAETYVYFLVGTNIAFLEHDKAIAMAKDNSVIVEADTPTILRLPAGYLSPQTKIIYGDLPEHKPAQFPASDPAAAAVTGETKE